MALLIKSDFNRDDVWRDAFRTVSPDLECRSWAAPGDVAEIDYAFVWKPEKGALRRFPNLKCIFSIGAGVDHLLTDSGLPEGVPVVRMVEPELTRGMAEYVALHVLRYHRGLPELQQAQRARHWHELITPTAPQRRVGLMGFGVLGQASAAALGAFGFDLACWTRTAKDFPGGESFHGDAGLRPFLARAEILVCLLPLTPETAGILNRNLFAALPRGAYLINAARGGHQNEDDILAALDSGQLAGATLDVFQTEPLPKDHAFWSHPRVTITAHIASVTQPPSAAAEVVANIRRIEAGESPINTVNRAAGY
jgi:glyoxylate/hydroxypyruvate reductase A